MFIFDIDKDSFLDFGINDNLVQNWGYSVYHYWAKKYSNSMKNNKKKLILSDYWSRNDPLEYYCGNAYANANKYYRHGETGNDYFDSLLYEINSIIDSAPRVPENLVVYRALNRIDYCDFKEPFMELAPMSTSLSASILMRNNEDPSSDFSYCPYALKIYVSKGAKAVFIDCLGEYRDTFDRNEMELLFPSGSQLCFSSSPINIYGKKVFECLLVL